MSTMQINVAAELAALQKLTVGQLRARYAEVYGEPSRSGNRPHLIKRIIWRLQALAEGGISERARRRAAELLDEARLRQYAPRERTGAPANPLVEVGTIPPSTDRPPPGTVLRRKYKERTLLVRVLSRGFEFEGEIYRSLTAIAEKVTGCHWNGRQFFGLKPGGAT